ncbi:MAG: DUF1566 domain-containing protein [Gammaproteobacteria bacterium]|nr:DUF1566 domain-containing protein [Gammaproteobacteria bacterium]
MGLLKNIFRQTGRLLLCLLLSAASPSVQAIGPFQSNEDGTVSDLATQLTWQQEDDEIKRIWFDAGTYCNSLGLAGYSDWRLPTIYEFASILDYSRYEPAIDSAAFPNTEGPYWSASVFAGSAGYTWSVNLSYGGGGNVNYSYNGSTAYARCVRGTSDSMEPSTYLAAESTDTVMDTVRNLVWQRQTDGNSRHWTEAKSYCSSLYLAGYDDWRLPSIEELKRIIEYSDFEPVINTDLFPNAYPRWYWSGSAHAYYAGSAWGAMFYSGSVGHAGKSDPGYARCVRSDAKLDNLVIFPAPQTGSAPLTVSFNAGFENGQYPYIYAWDFGDGSLSDDTTPNHAYADPGAYTVTLTVTDSTGNSVDADIIVTVNAPVNEPPACAGISADPADGFAPLTVNFSIICTDPEGKALRYLWKFGDGSSSTDPVHTYINPGVRSASVIVTDSGGLSIEHSVEIEISACTVNIRPENRSHTAESNSNSISVTAPTKCAWTAESDSAWLKIFSDASGIGDGMIAYTTDANLSKSIRTGILRIAGQTFTVTQEGIDCSYTITPSSRSHTANAGNDAASVSAPAACSWTAFSNTAWISLASDAENAGNSVVSYNVAANPDTASRTGTLTIAEKTFSVSQSGRELEPDIRLSTAALTFDNSPPVTRRRLSGATKKTRFFNSKKNLFSETGTAVDEPDPAVFRSRQAALNPDALQQETAEGFLAASSAYAKRLELNLFADVRYTAVNARVSHYAENIYVWTGKLEGVEFGDAVLAVKNGLVSGSVNANGDVYRIYPRADGTYRIQHMNPAAFPAEGHITLPADGTPQIRRSLPAPRSAAFDCPAEGSPLIDVAVVYTERAKMNAEWYGTVDIETQIIQAVEETNTAYANSGIDQRLCLVHMQEIPGMGTGTLELDLNHLINGSDGHFDEAHTLRDAYRADIVSLWVAGGNWCGLAPTMSAEYIGVGFKEYAFNVIAQNCATAPQYSFGHELAHTMGAEHDIYNDPEAKGAYPYSHGHVHDTGLTADSWTTIMAYERKCKEKYYRCKRILHFSNPLTVNPGDSEPTGVRDAADNARTLNNTAPVIAKFHNNPHYPREESKQFAVYNDGEADLKVSAIEIDGGAAWITVMPVSFSVPPGGQIAVTADVNYADAPPDLSTRTLSIYSNDPDENPAILTVQVTRHPEPSADLSSPDVHVTLAADVGLYLAIGLSDGQVFGTHWILTRPDELIFDLDIPSVTPLLTPPPGDIPQFQTQPGSLGELTVPGVVVPDATGNPELFKVTLQLVPAESQDKLQIRLTDIAPIEVRVTE